jgi:hypothetical protein
LAWVFGRFFGLFGTSPHSAPLRCASLRSFPCNPERGAHRLNMIAGGEIANPSNRASPFFPGFQSGV